MQTTFTPVITTTSLCVVRADYTNPAHAAALVSMLDAYARDAMGGGGPLSDFAKTHLVPSLAARPNTFAVLAFADADATVPIGLVICVEGFSTFACQPLVNVHDVAVLPAYRGQRVAEKMLALVELIARERGACKLTLEVLNTNSTALKLYQRVGFGSYKLGDIDASAQFLQKKL